MKRTTRPAGADEQAVAPSVVAERALAPMPLEPVDLDDQPVLGPDHVDELAFDVDVVLGLWKPVGTNEMPEGPLEP